MVMRSAYHCMNRLVKATKEYPLANGVALLAPASCMLFHNGKALRLSPLEFSLTQYFLDKTGTIIPLRDLASFFVTDGASVGAHNVRVTLYQLRLKLEEFSDRQLTIATVFRKGYILRKLAPPSNPDRQAQAFIARVLEKDSTESSRICAASGNAPLNHQPAAAGSSSTFP